MHHIDTVKSGHDMLQKSVVTDVLVLNKCQNISDHRVDYIMGLGLYESYCTILILLNRGMICFRSPKKFPVSCVSWVSTQNPAYVSLVPVRYIKVTEGREKIEVAPSFRYLGDCLSAGGGCELDAIIRRRVLNLHASGTWAQTHQICIACNATTGL